MNNRVKDILIGLVYAIVIIAIILFLCGCTPLYVQKVETQTYYKDWCSNCGNKGWIECDICYKGKMLGGEYICWKCGGRGKIRCTVCNIINKKKGVRNEHFNYWGLFTFYYFGRHCYCFRIFF